MTKGHRAQTGEGQYLDLDQNRIRPWKPNKTFSMTHWESALPPGLPPQTGQRKLAQQRTAHSESMTGDYPSQSTYVP